MNNDLDLIAKRDRLKKVLTIGVAGAVGLLVSPFIFAAIGV